MADQAPSRFLALKLALPGETGKENRSALFGTGLSWSAGPFSAARWDFSLILPAFSTPLHLPLELSSHFMNREYLIACSKENLLIGSRLDYSTCFTMHLLKKKSIKTGEQIKYNLFTAVFESSDSIL